MVQGGWLLDWLGNRKYFRYLKFLRKDDTEIGVLSQASHGMAGPTASMIYTDRT